MPPGDLRRGDFPKSKTSPEDKFVSSDTKFSFQSVAQRRLKNRQSAALSRQRKKEYINNLEKTTTCLTTEKLELQLKVATLTNQTWEQKLKVRLFKMLTLIVKDRGA